MQRDRQAASELCMLVDSAIHVERQTSSQCGIFQLLYGCSLVEGLGPLPKAMTVLLLE